MPFLNFTITRSSDNSCNSCGHSIFNATTISIFLVILTVQTLPKMVKSASYLLADKTYYLLQQVSYKEAKTGF